MANRLPIRRKNTRITKPAPISQLRSFRVYFTVSSANPLVKVNIMNVVVFTLEDVLLRKKFISDL